METYVQHHSCCYLLVAHSADQTVVDQLTKVLNSSPAASGPLLQHSHKILSTKTSRYLESSGTVF